MKIRISCQECQDEGYRKDKGKRVPYIPSYPYWQHPSIELDKWPFFEFTCESGHTTRFTLGLELYELLFQQATYCVMDGYYREGIATYNAALERFFEYAIEIISLSCNIDKHYEKVWKEISRQSERQLGAYYALFTTQFKEAPQFLDKKKVELRNAVVHKGKLASKQEALEFGTYVFEYIRSTKDKFVRQYGDNLHILSMQRLFRICKDDLKKAEARPIKVIVDGKEEFRGVGSVYVSCFLNQESIKSYNDCFKEDIYKNMGLQK